MQIKNFLFLVAVLGGLVSCASSSRVEKHQLDVDGVTISWQNFSKLNSTYRTLVPLGAGESIYMVSRNEKGPEYTLSNGHRVTLADCGVYMRQSIYNIYNECQSTGINLAKKTRSNRSFSDFKSLAARAVKKEGTCTWGGYDRAFDLSVRSRGKLAAFSDERLFFAKMRCD